MVPWFLLRILAVAFILNAVYAQDRSRSRYAPSTADAADFNSEEVKAERVPFTRRVPSRRTRLTEASDEENSQLAENQRVSRPRLPSHLEPHLEDSYDTRQSLRDQTSYHAPDSDVQRGTEDTSSNVPQRRRKRPKKRRRPKIENNNIPEIHNVQIQPSSESPPSTSNIGDGRDYLAYRNPELIPTTETTHLQRSHESGNPPLLNTRGHGAAEVPPPPRTAIAPIRDSIQRYDPKAAQQDPQHETIRRGSVRDVTQRGDSRDSIRYIGDVHSTVNDDTRRDTERSYRRQNYQPQQSSNRLPVDNVDEHSRFRDQAKDYVMKLPENLSNDPLSHPQSGYPVRQPPGDYPGGYIPVANPDATRLSLQGHPSEDRLPPGIHETVEPAIRLLPTEQPLNVPIYNHNHAAEQSDGNIRLTSDIENVKDQESNTRYPVASNRLPEPGGVSYQQQGNAPSFSHAEKDLGGNVKLGPHLEGEDDTLALTSDRLPPESHRRSLPVDEDISLARLPRPELRPQPTPAAVSTRTGSRYQPEHDRASSYARSTNEQIQARQQPNQLRTNTDPRYQRGTSRYRSHTEAPIHELEKGETETGRQRTDSRSRSRFQSEDMELARRIPTRSQQQEQHVRGTSAPQRSIPTSQRVRSQYRPDSETDVPDRETHRRIPHRQPEVSRNVPNPGARVQRTRSDYPQANTVQPHSYSSPSEYQDHEIRQTEPSHSRQTPNQGRTRSRHQPQYPSHLSEGNRDEDKHEAPRPTPHYDSNSRHSEYSDRPRNSQPEYVPEYQSVPRVPQRRPEPRPTPSHSEDAEVRSPQRVAYRHPETEAPRSRHTSVPTSRSPRRGASEEPDHSSASSSGRSNFRCPEPYGFYPDENQCDKYYECRNGTAEVGLCSDGLAFNLISAPTYLRCDSIRDIDCSQRPELQTPQSTKNCPRRFGLYGDESDCTKFWHCVDGSATQVQCPPGLVYDDTKGTCNWADLVEKSCRTEDLIGFNCPEASPAELQAGVYTRYPHPDNCQLHFTCIKGADGHRRPRLLSCNEGSVFDPETSKCTRPENVPGCEEFYGKPTRAPPRKPAREPPPPPPEPEIHDEEEDVPRTRSQRRRRPSSQRSRS